MDAAATINFKSAEARRLLEGGYYSRAAFITINGQNSGRGLSKRTRAADERRGNGVPSGRNVLLRQRFARAPHLKDANIRVNSSHTF